MTLNVSTQMVAKLQDAGDAPILDSIWRPAGSANAEVTQGSKGTYISSPADGWLLHGPFDAVL